MPNTESDQPNVRWTAKQAYLLAGTCLVAGLLLGYLGRGSAGATVSGPRQAEAASPNTQPKPPHQMPSLADMKHMADKQAEPLLAKLKDHPDDAQLLAQIGGIYMKTHQFKEAGDYYSRSLKSDPKNVVTRDALASSLYYSGDADGAIQQLESALKDNAHDANTLFNLGVIRWKAKNDTAGAVTAWQQLLKFNPALEAAKRSQVQKLIADVRAGNKQSADAQ